MIVEAQIAVRGSQAALWAAITDVARAADLVKGIESIELVETPPHGLVGLRWKETRILFDKPATVEKGITEAVEGESYTTRAESDGFVFITTVRISGAEPDLTLTSSHESLPQTFGAKLSSIPMALFFKGVIRKHILADLEDYRAAVERG